MSTTSNEVIVRFDNATFDFGPNKHILDEVDFSMRRGMKMTLMGQNGAGKSTIFKMIMGELSTKYGKIHVDKTLTIAIARQVMTPEDKVMTVRDFFATQLGERPYNLDGLIGQVLATVHLVAPLDRVVSSFSGGQQARLLLAGALIREPDLLLLDEPTNNLDQAGIEHLTEFLTEYPKSVLVISHDADFLNAFTDGVYYLDVHTHKVEQYLGNYHTVVEEISKRIERENMKNARLMKEAQANKEQAEVFAHKGGKLRLVAKKMREKAEELEESVVDVRREDRTIRAFDIPVQEGIGGEILRLDSVAIIRNYERTDVPYEVSVRRGRHVLLEGPNGIGKSTLLESIVNGTAAGMHLAPGVKVGYYRQDFSNLDFDKSVRDVLIEACQDQLPEQDLRSRAA
ncbi:MAG TPA: ATP-binding cassette domain-containing protein [bacterium]|nr:ATP-binding cassette domain-containing protein [bacterium]